MEAVRLAGVKGNNPYCVAACSVVVMDIPATHRRESCSIQRSTLSVRWFVLVRSIEPNRAALKKLHEVCISIQV